jgi:hypothetical protein
MRVRDGLEPRHASVLAQHATFHIASREYALAKPLLEEAINATERGDVMDVREAVRFLVKLVYVNACLSRFDAALQVSDKAISLARRIDRREEMEAIQEADSAPALPHASAQVIANFGALDARLHYPGFTTSKDLRFAVLSYWDRGHTDLDIPRSWNPPMMIQALSDPIWVKCAPDYVEEIAESLYIETANNKLVRVYRTVQTNFSGFEIMNLSAAAALIVCCFLLVADSETRPIDIVAQRNTMVDIDSAMVEQVHAEILKMPLEDQQRPLKDLLAQYLAVEREIEYPPAAWPIPHVGFSDVRGV